MIQLVIESFPVQGCFFHNGYGAAKLSPIGGLNPEKGHFEGLFPA